MKKRVSAIACLTVLILVMTASFAFAGTGFDLKSSYPEDGQTNTTVENMSVKLEFTQPVGAKEYREANEKCFNIVDNKGKKLPTMVLFNPKNDKEVLVLVDMTKIDPKKNPIKDNTKYTLNVSGKFTDNEGVQLGKDHKITYTTLNQGWNTKVYMIMMVVMFVGMFFFSSRQMKKQNEDEDEIVKEEPFNPYKEAKKTGKPLEEVMAEHEKVVAKRKAKEAKEAKRAAKIDEEIEEYEEKQEERRLNHYKVKGVKTVAQGGSEYKTGRKAIAEAKAAEEERLAKRRAANKKKKKK